MSDLTNSYRNMQKEEDKKVFYGERDIIERPGFDSIESFDKGIKDVKNEISDYDELLLENQRKLKEITREEDFYKVHPEVALPGEVSKLYDMYVSLIDKKKMLLEKQEKSKKNLMELEEAKKEFIREKRKFYKNDVNDRMSLLNEHNRKQQEMKELEYKISIGGANEFEKERYNVLKNEIIPEIEERLSMRTNNNEVPSDSSENNEKNQENNEEKVVNDDEQEIVNEEDGTELTKKEKFKKIAKKVLKWSAIVGGVALVAGAIYQFMQGDTTSISQVMHGAADAVNNVAGSVDSAQVGLNSTSVGDISNIFQSNVDVMNGVNAMTPNEWASDQIVGIVDANNNVYDAGTIGDIVNAQNQGIDVQSVAVGNGSFTPGNVSGFVDIDSVSLGGKSR